MSQDTAVSEAASAPGVRAATHVPRTWKAYFAVRPEVYVCCVFHKRSAEMSPSLTTAIRHRCAHKHTFTHLHVPHAHMLSSRSLLDQKHKSSNMTMSTTHRWWLWLLWCSSLVSSDSLPTAASTFRSPRCIAMHLLLQRQWCCLDASTYTYAKRTQAA